MAEYQLERKLVRNVGQSAYFHQIFLTGLFSTTPFLYVRASHPGGGRGGEGISYIQVFSYSSHFPLPPFINLLLLSVLTFFLQSDDEFINI